MIFISHLKFGGNEDCQLHNKSVQFLFYADLNARDGEGYTPLHLAAMYGSIQVVKKLVELNADVNLKVDRKKCS